MAKALRIFSTAPNGNEAADLSHADYMNLAIANINEEAERMKDTDMIVQVMLAHIDILLHLSNKFMQDAELLIELKDVRHWEETFNDWYERVHKRIPAKFREGIKSSAEDLFAQLKEIGH